MVVSQTIHLALKRSSQSVIGINKKRSVKWARHVENGQIVVYSGCGPYFFLLYYIKFCFYLFYFIGEMKTNADVLPTQL